MLLIYPDDKKSLFLRWAAADLSQRFFGAHSLANNEKQPALYSQALAVSCALIRCKSALILRALKTSVKNAELLIFPALFQREAAAQFAGSTCERCTRYSQNR